MSLICSRCFARLRTIQQASVLLTKVHNRPCNVAYFTMDVLLAKMHLPLSEATSIPKRSSLKVDHSGELDHSGDQNTINKLLKRQNPRAQMSRMARSTFIYGVEIQLLIKAAQNRPPCMDSIYPDNRNIIASYVYDKWRRPPNKDLPTVTLENR